MELQTPVHIPDFPFGISHKDKVTFIGSCFANNMGQHFIDNKLDTLINPFGVLYNPYSVSKCINTLLDGCLDERQLFEHNGVWHSFTHHSSFSNTSREQCIDTINNGITQGKEHLLSSSIIFLTLGTATIYEKDQTIVSNCHKLPSRVFTERRLSIEEIVTNLSQTIERLQTINSKAKIIFTVSPVRYTKEGLHANTLSKATLHMAIEQLCQLYNCFYFPAYEIVTDELRDYRFFKEDMTHPSKLAVDYIWNKLKTTFFDKKSTDLFNQINKIVLASKHKPFNTDPEAHQLFLDNMYRKASNLQKQYPELDLNAELNYFSS